MTPKKRTSRSIGGTKFTDRDVEVLVLALQCSDRLQLEINYTKLTGRLGVNSDSARKAWYRVRMKLVGKNSNAAGKSPDAESADGSGEPVTAKRPGRKGRSKASVESTGGEIALMTTASTTGVKRKTPPAVSPVLSAKRMHKDQPAATATSKAEGD